MTKILFNATQSDEVRVAIIDGRTLCDLLIDHPGREQKKANIYKGRVTRVEPSLEAAFVDYGQERHGFLPLKELSFDLHEGEHNQSRPHIRDLIKEGQEILIQVDKEERGNKGAALSTFISLAGSYLVLMPNNPKAGGVSRRIEGDDRQDMKEALSTLTIPEGMGVIIRTAGVGRSTEELQWDLNYLIKLWDSIQHAINNPANHPPYLVYQESDVILRALRDYMRPEVDEIIVDNEAIYNKIRHHVAMFRPEFADRVRFYKDATPIFTRYQIESQLESVYQRNIRLPSGGSIVIDRTEALVAIDINSAQATKGGDIEETAFNTNLEAANEIARQLRLRDLGGLIVIDFIDMVSIKHQREVEDRLNEAVGQDRARIQLGRISRFGLLEMSRQRLRSAVGESVQEVCPRCHGRGTIRSVESLAISILRLIEENAVKEGTSQVHAQVPLEVGTYLLNEKRKEINELETKHQILVLVIPNQHILTPDFEVTRFRQTQLGGQTGTSYKMAADVKKSEIQPALRQQPEVRETPAVKDILPEQPAPAHTVSKGKKTGFFTSLTRFIERLLAPKKEKRKPTQSRPHQHRDGGRYPASSQRNNQQRSGNRPPHRSQQRRPGGGSNRPMGQGQQGGNNPNNNNHNRRHTPRPAQEGQTPSHRNTEKMPRPAPVATKPIVVEVRPEISHAQPQQQARPTAPAPRPVENRAPAAPVAKPVENVRAMPKEVPQPIQKPAYQPVKTEVDPRFQQVETQNGQAQAVVYKEPVRVRPVRAPKAAPKAPQELVMIETQRTDQGA